MEETLQKYFLTSIPQMRPTLQNKFSMKINSCPFQDVLKNEPASVFG